MEIPTDTSTMLVFFQGYVYDISASLMEIINVEVRKVNQKTCNTCEHDSNLLDTVKSEEEIVQSGQETVICAFLKTLPSQPLSHCYHHILEKGN